MKKTFFLILTLIIPGSIFLFLKFFGTNTFDVPVLFENGIPACINSTGLHKVPDFEYIGETEKNLTFNGFDEFIVFGVLDGNEIEKTKEKIIDIVRIQDAFFETGAPKFVILSQASLDKKAELKQLCSDLGLENENLEIAFMPKETFLDFLKCGIALIDPKTKGYDNLVLVDLERRIRGIYNINEIEQTDQLILELKILKQKM